MVTAEERHLGTLDKLWTRYTKGKGYAGFILKTLIQDLGQLNRDTSEKWELFKGWLIATVSVPTKPDLHLDYGFCKYQEIALTEAQAYDFLKRMAIDRNCTLSGEVVLLKDSSSFSDYGYTAESYFKRHLPFSHSHFNIRFSDNNWGNSTHLVAKGLPSYPDITALAHDKFDTDLFSGSGQGELLVYFPRYAARILTPEFGRRRVTVPVEVKQASKSGYTLKLWALADGQHVQLDAPVTKAKVSFRLPVHPKAVMLFLTDDDTDEVVHYWGGKSGGVPSLEDLSTSNNWLDQIRQGEGPSTEFKHWPEIEGKLKPYAERIDPHKIAKSLVAFSNAEGGTLFIGVDDEGNLHGVDDLKNLKRKIADIASSQCVPPVRPKLKEVTLSPGGKKVLAVTVEAGQTLRMVKGVTYIRLLATSRPAVPEEVAEIMERKQPQDLASVLGASAFGRRRRP